jgi:hypothetical protein
VSGEAEPAELRRQQLVEKFAGLVLALLGGLGLFLDGCDE